MTVCVVLWLLALAIAPFYAEGPRNVAFVRAGTEVPFSGAVQMAFPAPADPKQARLPASLRSKQYYAVEPSEVTVHTAGVERVGTGLTLSDLRIQLTKGRVALSSETKRVGDSKETTTSYIDGGLNLQVSGVLRAEASAPPGTYFVTLPVISALSKAVYGSHGVEPGDRVHVVKAQVLPGGAAGLFALWKTRDGAIWSIGIIGVVILFFLLLILAVLQDVRMKRAQQLAADQDGSASP